MKKNYTIIVLAFILTSCIEYTESMKLNNDGSGIITFAVGISEEISNFSDDKNQTKDFNQAKIEEHYSGKEGIKILDSKTYAKDGNIWIELKLEFDSLENLQKASQDSANNGMIGNINLTEDENGNWVYTRRISNSDKSNNEQDSSASGVMKMMFSKYQWKYELQLPTKIISTNATEEDINTENNSVKWKFNLASLSANQVMTVVFEKQKSSNIAYVIIGAVLLIILSLAALNFTKKKKVESD